MTKIRAGVAAAVVIAIASLQPLPVMAQGRGRGHAKHAESRYDAARDYRPYDGRKHKVKRLGRNDRIYRGLDDRYYCKRDDGTTGLIVGGMIGGVLGHVIAPGDSKTLGTIRGAGAGALIGREVDRGDITCR